MRYIGSKRLLLKEIEKVINENITENINIFCDIFSGTGIVSEYFKEKYMIISNDLLYFSYIMQRVSIMENMKPDFTKLKKYLKQDPLSYFNNFEVKLENFNYTPFIFENYSPNDKSNRMYFSNENALRIDFIRQKIDEWKREELIQENEYFYLLSSLINSIPFFSNTAGTYGAYLKHWDKRALKKLILDDINILNNLKDNISYNEDANDLIKQISGDILYIDPPYNTRQYLPNYHLLETVAKYDYPNIYGKTGMRPYQNVKSKYCLKLEVLNEFDSLIKSANFKHIIMSYSNEGIMTIDEIKNTLFKYGEEKTFKLYKIPYRRYKHKKDESINNNNLEELLFYIKLK